MAMKTIFLIVPTAVAVSVVSCRHTEPEPPTPPTAEISEAEKLRLAEQRGRQEWQRIEQSFGKDFFESARTARHRGWTIYGRNLKLTADSVESRGPVLAFRNNLLLFSSQADGFLRVDQLSSDQPSVELKRFQILRVQGNSPPPWSHLLKQ
jgi:hypothetical protein